MNYILNKSGEPQAEHDFMAWADWFNTADRTVERTKIGDAKVSTVFLGIDHNFGDYGTPVLWETMVFGGNLDGECERYTSRGAAEAGHAEMVERALRESNQSC